ncbi:MAG: DUF1574 family protein [Candidatus Azobacteroides sp.]|nr:DUF1574 family protein [Candidatus Azobacteroides sp.]
MKRFILKTCLLLLPIVVLAGSMEYLLRQIPNDYTYKKGYLDKHAEEIELLILGSSDAYYGINPVYFSQNTFNACHVSQTLDLDLKVFNKYQDRLNDLKFIIIPISYPTLWVKLESGVESWRIKNYALYYGIKTKSPEDNSELLNGKLGINIERLYKYYVKKKNDIFSSELGWGTNFSSGNAADLEKTGKATASYHTIKTIYSKENAKIFTENIEILNSFAELCNRKDVKLILITPPAYRSYRENLNAEQWNKTIETMDDFAAKHNNCYYINWLENPDFTAADFYDANHLNEIGAKKLSEKLACYIDSIK